MLAYDAKEVALALCDSGVAIAKEARDLATRLREILNRHAKS